MRCSFQLRAPQEARIERGAAASNAFSRSTRFHTWSGPVDGLRTLSRVAPAVARTMLLRDPFLLEDPYQPRK